MASHDKVHLPYMDHGVEGMHGRSCIWAVSALYTCTLFDSHSSSRLVPAPVRTLEPWRERVHKFALDVRVFALRRAGALALV